MQSVECVDNWLLINDLNMTPVYDIMTARVNRFLGILPQSKAAIISSLLLILIRIVMLEIKYEISSLIVRCALSQGNPFHKLRETIGNGDC